MNVQRRAGMWQPGEEETSNMTLHVHTEIRETRNIVYYLHTVLLKLQAGTHLEGKAHSVILIPPFPEYCKHIRYL